MEEKNRLNAKQCSDQELKKIRGGAGTKPQGKPASNLMECAFSLYYLPNQARQNSPFT